MIIDIHGHVTAPPEVYGHQARLLADRGCFGRPTLKLTDDRVRQVVQPHLKAIDEVGIELQLISPRPYIMAHAQTPHKIVQWFTEEVNNLIARHVEMYPDRFQGVAGLPQGPGVEPAKWLPELERCITELGFVGALINPDPAEGMGHVPPMGDRYWYPLYEKLVELDCPILIHSAGCNNGRESYSNHFITEGSIALLSLMESDVLDDFPELKIISGHGGGSVPYQIGRWRATRVRYEPRRESFDDSLRRFWFDTALYNVESVEFLLRMVGADRCLLATEIPGTGSERDPATGFWYDDVKRLIDSIGWLTDKDRNLVYERNALEVFPRLAARLGAATAGAAGV
ncbi:amidohydrolase family protein [Polymorphospora sp. NPDC050346]|uniref:amidohydrolase family protein n=1 Tax=Polymorphospora sp. NPDC050346 TaxID=3155780 RepID=UPI0033D29327